MPTWLRIILTILGLLVLDTIILIVMLALLGKSFRHNGAITKILPDAIYVSPDQYSGTGQTNKTWKSQYQNVTNTCLLTTLPYDTCGFKCVSPPKIPIADAAKLCHNSPSRGGWPILSCWTSTPEKTNTQAMVDNPMIGAPCAPPQGQFSWTDPAKAANPVLGYIGWFRRKECNGGYDPVLPGGKTPVGGACIPQNQPSCRQKWPYTC